MREVSMKVYQFEELKGTARDRAADWLRGCASDHGWWYSTYEDASEIGVLMGFDKKLDINFSGFWSQGDGASFTGNWYPAQAIGAGARVREYAPVDEKLHGIADALERAAAEFREAVGPRLEEIHEPLRLYRTDTQYAHENTVCSDPDNLFSDTAAVLEDLRWDEEEIVGVVQTLEKAFLEAARNFMRWIYATLEQEYEFLTSDEQILELARSLEYEFTEDGAIYHE